MHGEVHALIEEKCCARVAESTMPTRVVKKTGRVGRGVGKGGSRHFSWPRAEICVHGRN